MEVEYLHRKKILKTARNHQNSTATSQNTLGNYAPVSALETLAALLGKEFFYKKMARKMKISALIFVCQGQAICISPQKKIQIGTNLKHYLTPRFSYKLFSRIALRKIRELKNSSFFAEKVFVDFFFRRKVIRQVSARQVERIIGSDSEAAFFCLRDSRMFESVPE